MDHIKILKRAWHITWNYRALWVFGIIVALTTASSGGSGSNGTRVQGSGDDFFPHSWQGPFTELPPEVANTLIAAGIALFCLIIVLIVVGVVAQNVGRTALIRMVNGYEDTGEKLSIREGFRLGWSRTAWRFFLIDLVIGLPTTLVFILLLGIAALPLLLLTTQNQAAGVIGTVATIGLGVLIIFLAIITGALLSLLLHFFRRVCALEEMGVVDSIRQGFALVRAHPQDVGVMWLIMIGLGLGWLIVLIPIMIMLLPIMLVFVLLGGVLGGIPALLIGLLTSLVFEGAVPYIVAGVIGLPIFILVVGAPMIFLGGLVEVFKSSTWTLTYRELRALESLAPELDPDPEPDPEPAPEPDVPLPEDSLPAPDASALG